MITDTCDHVDDVTVDEEGVHDAASQVVSCPDFKCNPECHAELLAKGVQMVDTDEYLDVNVNLIFGGRIDIGIVTKHNLPTDEAHERIQELQEALQELNDDTLHIIDADFYISFMYPQTKIKGTPDAIDADGNPIEFKTTEAERALRDAVQENMAELGGEVQFDSEPELDKYICSGHIMQLGMLRNMQDGAVVWAHYQEHGEREPRVNGPYRIRKHDETTWALNDGSSFADEFILDGPNSTRCVQDKGEGNMTIMRAVLMHRVEPTDEPEECPICGAVFRGKTCGGCGYENTSEDWRG